MIMREFAKLEISNSQRLGTMWGRVLTHHKEQADQMQLKTE